ncbi:MAG TPA: hypothetical protein VNZ44_13135 [Pyrinomonadaceae bacterium]|nr:hypothetical protein [Pyrinomonadaceae bacterium]
MDFELRRRVYEILISADAVQRGLSYAEICDQFGAASIASGEVRIAATLRSMVESGVLQRIRDCARYRACPSDEFAAAYEPYLALIDGRDVDGEPRWRVEHVGPDGSPNLAIGSGMSEREARLVASTLNLHVARHGVLR